LFLLLGGTVGIACRRAITEHDRLAGRSLIAGIVTDRRVSYI
jgi:hypothetical protein